jgi:hypothetical protein
MLNFSELCRSLNLKENEGFTPGDQGERNQAATLENSLKTPSETPSEAPSPSSTETAPKQASASDRLREIARHKPTTYDIRTLNFPDNDDEEMSRKS